MQVSTRLRVSITVTIDHGVRSTTVGHGIASIAGTDVVVGVCQRVVLLNNDE